MTGKWHGHGRGDIFSDILHKWVKLDKNLSLVSTCQMRFGRVDGRPGLGRGGQGVRGVPRRRRRERELARRRGRR